MFVYSMRGSTVKYIGVVVLSVVALALTVLFIPKDSAIPTFSGDDYGEAVYTAAKASDFKNIKTAQDRINFLYHYGWEVEENAVEIIEVTIPPSFDAVYAKYNEVQKVEGLDLEKYKGKNVKRYTYVVKNYDYNGTVYANLIIYKDRVIGGDICSADINGFMHGFTKGNNLLG